MKFSNSAVFPQARDQQLSCSVLTELMFILAEARTLCRKPSVTPARCLYRAANRRLYLKVKRPPAEKVRLKLSCFCSVDGTSAASLS